MNDQPGDPQKSQPEDEVPPDLFETRISGTRGAFPHLIQQFSLDIGCRGPQFERQPDGTFALVAYASEDKIRQLRAAGYKIDQGENVSAVGRERQQEVGRGDRFESGRIPPQGLGEKPGYGRKGGTTS